MKKNTLLLTIIILLYSCKEYTFTESYTLPSIGWEKDKMINFNFEIEDSSTPYNIYWVVRNNNKYPYKNLILFTKIENQIDTINYMLAQKDGKWLGSGITQTKELTFEYKKNYTFSKKGKQSIHIAQAMRKDTLQGIVDVSLIIDPVK